jgi:hypothetical protein
MSRSPIYIPSINTETQVLYPQDRNIPRTPAPKTIDAIQVDTKERFAGITMIQRDPDHKAEDYFADYDHWEIYSETKSYSKRTYQAAYKGVMREYHNYLFVLNIDDNQENEEYYVIAKRLRNELELLEPYCTCTTCSACSLNPLKYVWCPICTQCIKAGKGFAKNDYIIKAREIKQQAENRKKTPSKYDKYLQGIPWISVSEYLTVGAVAILFFWYLI